MTSDFNDMNHYVCTGECGGVSDKPGTCQDETCSKHGEPLVECGCEDNEHEKVLNPDKAADEE